MEKQLLWAKMKWWKVYCLRSQINVVCILAALHSPEEGGNMAGAKTARAEVWLFSNICVCVWSGGGLYFRQAVSSLEQAHTFSVCLLVFFPQHYFIRRNDCLVNKLSKRKLLESHHLQRLCPGGMSTTFALSLARVSVVWIEAGEVGRDQIMQGIVGYPKEFCRDPKSKQETSKDFKQNMNVTWLVLCSEMMTLAEVWRTDWKGSEWMYLAVCGPVLWSMREILG